MKVLGHNVVYATWKTIQGRAGVAEGVTSSGEDERRG